MNVLYITHCTDMSGANRSMVQMIVELRDNYGITPFVIYPKIYKRDSRTIEDALRENGIPGLSHKLTCFQRERVGIVYKIYYLFATFLYFTHLRLLLRNKSFDLVHSNSSVIDMGLLLSKSLHIPHVWHFREVASLSFGARPILGEKHQRDLYWKSDRIIAISNNVKQEFGDLIPPERTVVIPNGIVPPRVSHYPNHYADLLNICIVGRVEPNKNQMEAVKAIQCFDDETLKKIRLHIVGNYNGEYGNELERFISSNGLEEHIILHGVRNDVDRMLQDMNIGLMLSHHEAFGRVTVEYMMHRVCVIASNISANPEIIHDGGNGLLYDLGDPIELSRKIKLLVDNRDLLNELAEKGYEDAMKKYLSVTNSERVYDLYKTLF